MSIEFRSETQTATFYNPLADFAEDHIEVEIREDPLTGRQTRIVPDAFVEPETEPELDDSVTDGEGCFFCPDMVREATPTYPDFVGMDRGSVGEATSFPNLNPYGAHSNVVVLTEDHYVPIDELTAGVLADGLQAALEYVEAVFEHEDSATVASVNVNFLPSAGSSIVHPHVQTLVDDRGTNSQRARIEAAREYQATTGSEYFGDLVAATTSTDRYVGSTGDVEWLAPFAPRHHRHVRAIAPETGRLDPDSETVSAVASGIEHVLAHYADEGLNSFNFGLHVVDDEAMRPHVDVVARSVFQEYAWSDATFFETIHDESVVDVAPEADAQELARFF
jgi:galactose-1-phosphate uridylyltransferase